MKKKKKLLVVIFFVILTITNLHAVSVTRSVTKVQNGFSVTARFVFHTTNKQYAGRLPHIVNYQPANVHPYAYYLEYSGEYVTPDNTTATQYFKPKRWHNTEGYYYYPGMSMTATY